MVLTWQKARTDCNNGLFLTTEEWKDIHVSSRNYEKLCDKLLKCIKELYFHYKKSKLKNVNSEHFEDNPLYFDDRYLYFIIKPNDGHVDAYLLCDLSTKVIDCSE